MGETSLHRSIGAVAGDSSFHVPGRRDVAEVTRRGVQIFDHAGKPVERAEIESELSHDAGDKGQYRHYMQKEIFEQPQSILNTLEGRLVGNRLCIGIFRVHAREIFQKVQHVQIVAWYVLSFWHGCALLV